MKSKSTITVLVAALAVLSGVMGMTMTGVFSDQELMTASTKNVAVGLMTGHLEIEAFHENGEVYDYRQFDNLVVDTGEQCILKMLFASYGQSGSGNGRGGYTSTGVCTGALNSPWDVIAIGTGSTAVDQTDVKLGTESTGALARGVATEKTWSNVTSGIPQIVMKKTFTANGNAAVTESGLFNSTTVNGSGMLARNVFTAVNLTDGDSITITWTFKVGN